MARVFLFRKKHAGVLAVMTAALLLTVVFLRYERTELAANGTAAAGPRVIQIVTGEFESRTKDGRLVEAYTWHPGTVYIRKGETVELQLTGVSGGDHPFVIEGLGVKGEVTKGKTTTVTITPQASGTYPILCLTHMGGKDETIPMVGYIYVP